ncbi:type 2 lanthipeptide synthetase LanM family protein [Kitasatospora sp. NPDC058965]|uniref:type 2 lanthipeptide synthetase LanM family protein n=1 Tax=Kitasatospora sp. NPDC058965 TaxID=3346682 RepID=UPI0036912AEF
MDASALRRAAARAVPLSRRGRAADLPPAGAEAARRERADRILARWRAQAPFDRADWFERRLAADGLREDELRALLAEEPAALADRLGVDEPWVAQLVAAFEAPGELAVPAEHEFAHLFAPVLAAARDRLRQGLAALGEAAPGDPERLTALLLPALTAEAHAMAVRTVITELHIARLTGRLTGDTPEQRYRGFVDRLRDPAAAVDLLAEYPVLARKVTLRADQWATANLALLGRLAADRPALREAFAAEGELVELTTGLGDSHRGGATVCALRFANGARVVYKPRPLGAELHFQQLLEALNPQLSLPLLAVPVLARRDYGWMAHVTAEPARSAQELRDFYHRAGALAAVLYLLDAVDCHAQNLLAVRDQPVLIDLEALLHPDLPEPAKDLSASERLARHHALHSVLRSGLLPDRSWDEGNGGADLSALGWDPADLAPRAAPVLVGEGTDELRIEYRRLPVAAPGSRPVPAGELSRLADHTEELAAGFAEAYRVLAGDKARTADLVRAFAADRTRLLRRDTLEYRSLLATGCHPDLLRDGLDQDRHLDRLWALAAWEERSLAFVPHERADLWHNDVPLFTIRPDSVDARAASGAPIPGVAERPALEVALAKLDRLGPADLARQLRLLRLSVSTARGAVEPRREPVVLVAEELAGALPSAAALRGRALAGAVAAGEELLREAYRAGSPADLAWIGPNWAPPGRWAQAELGPDLYSGTAGVVLFLHQLGQVSGEAEFRQAALAAERTLQHQIRRKAGRLGGGLAGTGGLLYALAQLAAHRPGDSELDAAAGLLLARITATADEDAAHDLVAGGAGTIGGLLAWGTVRPGGPVTDAVARCARRLVAAGQVRREGGVGWQPQALERSAGRPLAGFAHGGSGIGWALAKAGELLGDGRLAELALDALDHERTLFDPKAANWRDVREPDESADHPVLWCHGAAGIALARVELAELLDSDVLRKERDIALETVVRHGFGLNFSLCHGDLGNLEPLLLAGEPWRTAGLRQAGSTLDALDRRGWVCGLPHGAHSPSLFVGLAGIGHGLLRLVAPQDVPALLALHPPIPQ